jgi:starch synthase (maltosyl-transferring)
VAHAPEATDQVPDGRRRVVIDAVRPEIDGGRHPIKRVVGDRVVVEADLLVDGHDRLAAVVLYRRAGETRWREAPMAPAVPPAHGAERAQAQAIDDRWRGELVVDALGRWEYTVASWVDAWASWAWALSRKVAAGHDVEIELRAGAALAAAAAARAPSERPGERVALRRLAERLSGPGDPAERAAAALGAEAEALMRAHPDRAAATTREPPLSLVVDPARARFSSWYELFPRSCGAEGRHGTFKDAEARLPYIAEMGFDVVYLPPIHPIGRSHRKGPDNSLIASPSDPGSPWAIGAAEGGHLAVHPQLGTLEDFRHFVQAARAHGIETALDIAFQTSPDHPWVEQHPEWFVHRADGTIQYAENPPKKYEDIYPFDFAGAAAESLWRELRAVFLHWIEQGVTIFRVDNPHTKPLPFWQWCIRTVKERHPETIFLAEAFTRPKVMHGLAKAGFSQSYTYFTWRTTKSELTEYVRSIVDSDVKEYFRPNFWPNTPDILPEQLQTGTRATFIARAVLAATLSPSWGIYGPPFELQERVAREGAEEYAHNEKYQLRSWDLSRPDSLRPILRRLNQIRRDNPALQRLDGTVFHPTDNELVICYSRGAPPLADRQDQPPGGADDGEAAGVLLVVVNLDPHNRQTAWITLDLPALGLAPGAGFQVHDLMGDARYPWKGARAFVALDPAVMPAQIFRVRRHVRSERTFEYYL